MLAPQTVLNENDFVTPAKSNQTQTINTDSALERESSSSEATERSIEMIQESDTNSTTVESSSIDSTETSSDLPTQTVSSVEAQETSSEEQQGREKQLKMDGHTL